MPTLSVIIPTHQRAGVLELCLKCLERQTVPHDLEVIVVNDGPDEKTKALCIQQDWRVPVRYDSVPKSQQACARNRGLELTTTPYTLFIGDDILLEDDTCENHINALHRLHQLHSKNSIAVLGHSTWDPAVGITPVMEWLEKSGWQFGYPKLRRYGRSYIPKHMQHRFSYTSHISLPTTVARAHLFRDDLSLYGWEDIEWGQRLVKSGVRLYYEPGAKALHHHHLSLDDSLERMQKLGLSIGHMHTKVPEMGERLPKGLKLLAYHGAALLPTMAGQHRRAFLKGLRQSSKNES